MRDFRTKEGEWDERRAHAALRESTQGLDVRWYSGKPDLSESPIGYKSAEEVRRQIDAFGLAEVIGEILPLGCIMAGRGKERDEELTPKQRRQIEHRADRRRDRQALREGNWDEGE